MKRLLFTAAFAATFVAAGFMLATTWEQPAQAVAHPTPGANLIPAADQYPLTPEGDSPFIKVSEAVTPVVVNITANKVLKNHPQIPDMFDWGPFFNQPRQGGGKVPHVTSGGSGIIVDREGYILTNNHVVSDADDIVVKFTDGSELPGKVIGADPETDVALVKVNAELPESMVAHLGDSDKIRIGEWAIAVGNPFGLDWTVTVGVISARGRSNLHIGGEDGPSYQNFIQTDASINFGNSGGPLVNIKGEVIGVNTAINAQGQGIGFAIPINLARNVMDQLRASGEVKRGYLGIFTGELNDLKREAQGIDPGIGGVFVEGVQENTPAAKAGLKGGEVITEINGNPVKNVTDFRFRIAEFPPGSDVSLTVLNGKKSDKVKVRLADRSEFVQLAAGSDQMVQPANKWLGLTVIPTNGRQGERMGVEELRGALVAEVSPGSPAAGLIEQGDVIVEVGGIVVESVENFSQAAERMKDRTKAIPFWVIRGGRRLFIPIKPE